TLGLYNRIAALAGASSAGSSKSSVDSSLDSVANDLWKHKGSAIVVSGSNDPHEQVIVNGINQLLGSYGSTIKWSEKSYLRQGDDAAMESLIAEMNSGQVDALFIYNTNPSYSYPGGKFASALAKVGMSVSFSAINDETSSACKVVCPDSHYLESWSDSMPYEGYISLGQPTIQALYKTRQMQDSMLKWMGSSDDYYTYLKNYWRSNFFNQQNGTLSSDAFWNKSLHDGIAKVQVSGNEVSFAGDVSASASKISAATSGLEFIAYEKTGIAAGQHANNPWLQELPDPISRICWDNYINMPQSYMEENGIEDGDIVEVSANNTTISGPAHAQPGQAPGTISAALGYGRTASGKVGDGVGFDVTPMLSVKNGALKYYASDATVTPTGESGHVLASTQDHGTIMGRSIVKEVGLKEYQADPNFEKPNPVNADYLLETHDGKKSPNELDLWATEKNPGHPKPNHHWGMVIDLNSCIGCGACVIACNAENNIPVVGKEEIDNSREMHWIRIDRYYSSDMTREKAKEADLGKRGMWAEMEKPQDNPQVTFQPMMCQHCNHAPCETVCPVAATTHSQEGLNMMAYNRCVGTRYCANNCPYKVRRFNWFKYYDNEVFDYNMNNEHGRMVLNPDVVVRSRGVMEKCTMCVQRIQYGKLEAKKERRRPVDGEIQTACAQVCPTNAITFGDTKDDKSKVAEENKSRRNYAVLEEYNVQPNVLYQVKVRNTEA
ncbi:MAG: 4Fe-4S dicluster domain-containing protein, partial [Bacteroidia bacterium]|nr:4Fe-4S dicluster domain-containing protein [Bacteroidia bacterium]